MGGSLTRTPGAGRARRGDDAKAGRDANGEAGARRLPPSVALICSGSGAGSRAMPAVRQPQRRAASGLRPAAARRSTVLFAICVPAVGQAQPWFGDRCLWTFPHYCGHSTKYGWIYSVDLYKRNSEWQSHYYQSQVLLCYTYVTSGQGAITSRRGWKLPGQAVRMSRRSASGSCVGSVLPPHRRLERSGDAGATSAHSGARVAQTRAETNCCPNP